MKFYTVKEVAKLMKVHEHTVRKWINSDELQAVKTGNVFRIPETEIKKMIK